MGEYLGIAHQLDNDAHDLYDLLYPKPEHTAVGKSDLFRGKKTLPVVLPAQEIAFEDGTSLSDERYRAALYTGIVQTWAIWNCIATAPASFSSRWRAKCRQTHHCFGVSSISSTL